MINRRTISIVAAVTFVLGIISVIIGEDRDVLYVVDDLAFFGFILSALLLVVLILSTFARAVRNRSQRSTNA